MIKTIPRLTVSTRFALALLVASTAAAAIAQAPAPWPAKPLRIVVGFSAGGPTDVVARAFAEHASKQLGQSVIVDNKPGANTILAAESVATAPADGYTLLLAATNHTMIPALYRGRVKFDVLRSFAPVCAMASSPTVLVVGPSMPAKTLAEFAQQVKAAPGKRTYGTPGSGSSGHFATEQFLRQSGLTMNHIPYKGAAQVVTDVMGGQLDSSLATVGSVLPQIQAGRVTALAVATPRRSALLPGVPTFDESGLPGARGYTADAWYGLLAPAGTPTTALQALTRAARTFVEQAATVSKLQGLGMEPQSLCGDGFASQMEREIGHYSKLAGELNLKAE